MLLFHSCSINSVLAWCQKPWNSDLRLMLYLVEQLICNIIFLEFCLFLCGSGDIGPSKPLEKWDLNLERTWGRINLQQIIFKSRPRNIRSEVTPSFLSSWQTSSDPKVPVASIQENSVNITLKSICCDKIDSWWLS